MKMLNMILVGVGIALLCGAGMFFVKNKERAVRRRTQEYYVMGGSHQMATDLCTVVKDVLAAEAAAILNIPESNPFTACVELFLESKQQGGKLVISGVGKAGEIGKKMAVTFCSVGLPSVFLHPLEAQHGDLGLLNAHDVLLLISNSGQTREIIELEILAKRLIPTLKVVALTGKSSSPLAKVSNLVLWTGDPKEACPLGLTPTTSTTVMAVIGDVLSVMLVQISGYKAEDYAKRHHSGYLGDAARDQTAQSG